MTSPFLLNLQLVGMDVAGAAGCLVELPDGARQGDIARTYQAAIDGAAVFTVHFHVAGAFQLYLGLRDLALSDFQIARTYEFDVRLLGIHILISPEPRTERSR